MRLVLSIPGLAAGGAERQFALLASGLAARGHQVLAVSLGQGGALEGALGQARLLCLGKASRLDNLRTGLALAGVLRRERAQVHYAFLPSCCVLGALAKTLAPAARLVFGIRAADALGQGRAGRLLLGLEALLSRRAGLVIANSRAGARLCLARGFPAGRIRVVPNGFDTDACRPDRELGAELRARWGVREGELLVGHVARLDPLKDHGTFLEAAALLARARPGLRFVCVGGGPEDYAGRLRAQAAALGLEGRLAWAGERQDMPRVYNALDALCLSSTSEGLPNVLGEAMSCGVPCASTDAGDAGLVLGGLGALAPAGDPPALAGALAQVLERLGREGEALRAACRERILAEFSAQAAVAATEELLLGL